jgi:hypothetical protein
MLESIVELLACLLFSVLTLMIVSSIVGSIVAALRAVGQVEAHSAETVALECRSGLADRQVKITKALSGPGYAYRITQG